MDYDRALFRVYERAIEDIGSTPSLFEDDTIVTTTTTTTTTTAPQQQQEQSPAEDQSQARDTSSTGTNTSTTTTTTLTTGEDGNGATSTDGTTTTSPLASTTEVGENTEASPSPQQTVVVVGSSPTGGHRPTFVPFTCALLEIVLPHWYIYLKNKCISCIRRSTYGRYAYHHLDIFDSSSSSEQPSLQPNGSTGDDENDDTSSILRQPRNAASATAVPNEQTPVTLSNDQGRGSGRVGPYHSNGVTTTTERFRQRALARMHAMRTNTVTNAPSTGRNGNNNESNNDDEENNNRRGSTGSNDNNDPTTTNHSNDGESATATASDTERSASESGASTNNGINAATGNNNNNNHQTGGPCSQKGLYAIMQSCMVLGLLNLYVIYCMHSTYVRPDIDNHSSILGLGLWNPSLSLHTQYHTLHLKMPSPPPGYILDSTTSADNNNEDDPTGHTSSSSTVVVDGTTRHHRRRATTIMRNTNNNEFRRRNTKKVTLAGFPPSSTKEQHSLNFYKGPTCIEYALSSRPPQFEWNDTTASSETNSSNTEVVDGTNHVLKNETSSKNTTTIKTGNWTVLPLLRDDEVLYIQIIYNAKKQCSTMNGSQHTQCSRTHVCKSNETFEGSENEDGNSINTTTTTGGGTNETTTSISKWDTFDYWESPMYKFSTMEALMYTPDHFLYQHNVSIVNVTLTERCLSMGSDIFTNINPDHVTTTAEWMTQIYGVMDTVMINQLMYGIRNVDGSYRNGFLQNTVTEERWSWSKDFLEYTDSRDPTIRASMYFSNVIGSLLASLIGFFLVTSVTALIVRILTSSGVVLMFPMFSLFRMMGLPGADDRLLGLSYPWIGRAQHIIRRRRIFPPKHLIWAHIAKMMLFYAMYEACQGAWSMMLYAKSIPAGLPIWIYGFAMIWEYYSMVFVRSALSVYFFPRITLLYYLAYHFYFYSIPYGYFDVALLSLFLFMVHAMIFCLLAFEIPALLRRGAMSIDCPREVYNQISYSDWTSALPQEWTLFLPLNSRYIPLHDRDFIVPPPPTAVATTDINANATTTDNGDDDGGGDDDNNDNNGDDTTTDDTTRQQQGEDETTMSSSFRQRVGGAAALSITRRTPSQRNIV